MVISEKFVGDRAIVERCVVTSRANAASCSSASGHREVDAVGLLAAAISNDSSGRAGPAERGGALPLRLELLAPDREGPHPRPVPSPVLMRCGAVRWRASRRSRAACPRSGRTGLDLSDRRLSVPELGAVEPASAAST